MKNWGVWITILIVSLFLSGCVTLKDPEASLEYTANVVGTLSSDQTIGQTIVSRRSGINGVQLWLRPTSPPTSPGDVIDFELYHSPQETQPLVIVPIPFVNLARSFPLTISFPPQHDPPYQSYYLLLKTQTGSVQVLGRSEDVYPEGRMLVDGVPQQADAAFRTSYQYEPAAMLNDLRGILPQIWIIIPLLIVLWLPGRLLLSLCSESLLSDNKTLDWGQRTALSIGLSLAIIPLVMLWTTSLDLRWNRIGLLAAAFVLAGVYLWKCVRRFHLIGRRALNVDKSGLLLFGIFLFSLAIRLVMVRDMAAPAWIDPVHHSTIVRVIVDQGGFPHDYAPYIETNSASYHPGFHSVVASFHWLSGLDITPAMLLLGQVLNALCALSVYLFTVTFTKDRIAGLIAAMIPAFFTPMPAYYTSWGRYTQLTGLLILPVCIAFIVRPLEKIWHSNQNVKSLVKEHWILILLASIACGGLAITHYRVIIFLGAFLVAHLLAQTLRSLNKRPLWQTIFPMVFLMGAVITGAVLLTLSWWPTLYLAIIAPKLGQVQPAPQPLKIDWGYLLPVYGKQVTILAVLGFTWSILRARWFGLTMVLWIGLLFMTANQGILRIPGLGVVNKTSVEIMLFMPLSLLAGFLVGSLIHVGRRVLPDRYHSPYHLALVLATSWLALFGARSMASILNPITFLFREADKPALAWIQDNLPPSETILINSFYWNSGVYAGQDGGYWITPMIGRKTIPPPTLYNLGDTQEINRINQVCRQVADQGKNPVNLFELMQEQKIHYVYLGVRGGVLSPKSLQESNLFRVVYQQDGVWIFERQ